MYPGRHARHEERRPYSPLYRLRGRSPQPSQPDYTEREATHDRDVPRTSRYPPHPRHEDRTSSYETRSPPRQRVGQGQYPPHQMTGLSSMRDPHCRASIQAKVLSSTPTIR
jgi:hypothetical protein